MAIIDGAFDSVVASRHDQIHQHAFNEFLQAVDDLLGLKLIDTSPDISDELKRLVIERRHARDNHDYARADQLRDELAKSGIAVCDTAFGSIWEYLA